MTCTPSPEAIDAFPATVAIRAGSNDDTASVSTSEHAEPSALEVVLRCPSDPLPSQPITASLPKQSVTSLQTFDDAAGRAVFKYPRFSTATSLSDTGGPVFSIEELTSTDVSEDEDAIINEPALRRRTLSRLSLPPSSLRPIPPISATRSDPLQKAAHYIRDLLASWVSAIVNYMAAPRDNEADPEVRGGHIPRRSAQVK